MAYQGNSPAAAYTSFAQQTFSIVNSQTSYTLDHPVANGKEILLYINNVKQVEGSGEAYTASGNTLTIASALTSGSDEMYCLFIGKAIQNVVPPSGSVTNAMLGETITVANGGTGVTTASALANTGNLVLLNSASSTVDVSQIDFDSTYINSTYDDYLLIINMLPASDAQRVRVRFFESGTLISSSSTYTWRANAIGGTSYSGGKDESAEYIIVGHSFSAGNAAGEGCDIKLQILNANNANRKTTCMFEIINQSSGDQYRTEEGHGGLNDHTTVIDGLRIYFASGSISEYDYKLYGIKK